MINRYLGEDCDLLATLTEDGAPVVLTGATVTAALVDGTGAAVATASCTITGATTGKASVRFTAAQLASLPAGSYLVAFKVAAPGGTATWEPAALTLRPALVP